MPFASLLGPVPAQRKPSHPISAMLLATSGYGLTFWAWTLIWPLGLGPFATAGAGTGGLMLLAAVSVLVGSLARIPVGVLTDRYGARAVLPAVSVVAALTVLLLVGIGSGPALLVVAVLGGLAGTSFAAGAAIVIRNYPPSQRGRALSVFGAGMGIATAGSLLLGHVWAVDHHLALPLLALSLVVHAVLAYRLLSDGPPVRVRRESWRATLAVVGMPAVRHLSIWYAAAFGGMVSLGLFLPRYLSHVHGVALDKALGYTALCLTVSALGRPVGGALCARYGPVGLLTGCVLGLAPLSLLLAFEPPFLAVAMPVLILIAAVLGVASGVVQAMIGATAPPERAGTIAGAVGAVAALAGLGPPLLLAAVYGATQSYAIGLTALAAVSVGGAAYLRSHAAWVEAALVFPATSAVADADLVVVAVPGFEHRDHPAEVLSLLAGAATRQELVVVVAGRVGAGPAVSALAIGLRLHLPRHRIITVFVDAQPHPHEVACIAGLLDEGAVPIVLTNAPVADPVAVQLVERLGAGEALRVTYHPVDGVALDAAGVPALSRQ